MQCFAASHKNINLFVNYFSTNTKANRNKPNRKPKNLPKDSNPGTALIPYGSYLGSGVGYSLSLTDVLRQMYTILVFIFLLL